MRNHNFIPYLFTFIVLSLCVLFSVQEIHAAVFPLKKSANNRYFVDQNNEPFFINGDTPWSLIGQVSKQDADYYLNDAKNKGINSITVTLVEGYYADRAPANFYGTEPFLTPNKFSTPNPSYFDHADYVIKKAASLGMNVLISPLYLGCCSDGWWNALSNDTLNPLTATSQNPSVSTYGTFIGNRYKDIPNIMYVWGNDRNPCGPDGDTSTSCTQRKKLKAIIDAVKAVDKNHLHTYHWSPENSPTELYQSGVWDSWDAYDFNVSYTYNAVQGEVLADYNRNVNSHPEPFFLFESHYENEHGTSPLQQRKQAYNAVLSGAAGQQYGNNPIWYMGSRKGWDPLSTDWKGHLGDEARSDLIHVKNLFESRAWYTLIPDQTHKVLTNGYSSGDSYAGAALTADASTFIAYIPASRSLSINLSAISGSQKKGYWYDPRNGTATEITTTLSSLTPPSGNDWVLVIDDASKNYPIPGTNIFPTSMPSPPITPTSVVSPTTSINRPCPLLGDTSNPSCDGKVDILDYSYLSGKFNSADQGADLDNNGKVNILDYTILSNNFGKRG